MHHFPLLAEMQDTDFGLDMKSDAMYTVRKAVRSIVFDSEGNVALLHVAKGNYYKIPGGGVEEGENLAEALHREVLEEAGVEIHIVDKLGIIIEYRSNCNLLQISYGFTATVVGEKKPPHFTEKELQDGFSLVRMPIDEAIHTVQSVISDNYLVQYVTQREALFLQAAKTKKTETGLEKK